MDLHFDFCLSTVLWHAAEKLSQLMLAVPFEISSYGEWRPLDKTSNKCFRFVHVCIADRVLRLLSLVVGFSKSVIIVTAFESKPAKH
jgi:hypothetical protein